MQPMELRHLRYFVAVAEELNFSRAAERLGIKQPPLSAQIRQLEKELGTQLFRRRARGVELTGAGKLFLEEARIILSQVKRAETSVRRRGRGETGRLIVGSAGATYFHPLIPAIIREYGRQYPDIVLAPQASHTALLMARLYAGKIDVALIWRPTAVESDDLVFLPLVDEDSVMALPAGHPLSKSTSAPLTALAQEKFVLYPRALNPSGYDSVILACQQAGFKPMLGQEAPQVVSVMPLVAAGLGVSVVPRSASRIVIEGVSYVSIAGNAPRFEISLAYRRNDRSLAVQNFVAVARRATRAVARTTSNEEIEQVKAHS
jgi:DNA-binding transcriptional LysR family regulator